MESNSEPKAAAKGDKPTKGAPRSEQKEQPTRKRRKRGTGTISEKHNLNIPHYIDARAMAEMMDQYANDLDRKTLGCLVSQFFSPLVEGIVRVFNHSDEEAKKVKHMLRGIGACVEAAVDVVQRYGACTDGKEDPASKGRTYYHELTVVVMSAASDSLS